MLIKWAPRRHASGKFHKEVTPIRWTAPTASKEGCVVSMQWRGAVHCEGGQSALMADAQVTNRSGEDRG